VQKSITIISDNTYDIIVGVILITNSLSQFTNIGVHFDFNEQTEIRQISLLDRPYKFFFQLRQSTTEDSHPNLVEADGFGECRGHGRDLFEVVSFRVWRSVRWERVGERMADPRQHLHHLQALPVGFQLGAQSLHEPWPVVRVLERHVSCNVQQSTCSSHITIILGCRGVYVHWGLRPKRITFLKGANSGASEEPGGSDHSIQNLTGNFLWG